MTTPNTKQPKRAIVFDLDDTLYPEIDFLKSAYHFISRQLTQDDTLYSSMLADYRNQQDVFAGLSQQFKVDKSQLLDWYRYHQPSIHASPGVAAFIEHFSNDYQFAIITDGRSITQRNKIKALQLDDKLNAVIISEEIGSEKPNVLNYQAVENQLDCEAYWYIGDNVKKDFITPNLLGWQTIGLKDQGQNIHSQNMNIEQSYLPHHFFDNWSEIFQYFQSIEKISQ